ncbi:hypothetical protein GSI_08587 [Ganoderma sinense ZZ0214-1]|uniref:Uncharacterized protein n=1 Tax=Ganoderma sinense ZZ0214-1 TaxID=1077348 RepID=A0A2G8S440_9APHY|nr:hypothetical protein GSI_08587 [Ganoderma sinense ZZ0214-1]
MPSRHIRDDSRTLGHPDAPGKFPTSSSSSSSSSLTSSSSPTSSSRPSTTSSSSILPSTSTTSSTSQAPPTTDGIVSTILVTASPAAATNASNPSPTPHHAVLSTGAIAGVAVGGAAVLVLAGLVIWFCRSRERRSRADEGTKMVDSDTLVDDIRSGDSQMSEAVAPAHRPRLLPALSSSSPSRSVSDSLGSHRLLLHPGSQDSVSRSSDLQLDGAAHTRRAASFPFLPSSQSPRDGVQNEPLAVHDEIAKSPSVELAPENLRVNAIDTKPDSPPMPPPTRPSRGPERVPVAHGYVAVPTDRRGGAGARSMRFEEDGGVRLAGGLPGEVLDDEGQDVCDSRRWVVQPPPYQRFR